MKTVLNSLFVVLFTIFASTTVYADDAKKAEVKQVCVDIKDKDGKVQKDAKGNPKQQCKEMKVHKKLEGTKVPEKK